MRRLVQGARYCDQHARGKNYVLASTGPAEMRECINPACGASFTIRRKVRGNAARSVWYEFCQDCRLATPLTLAQVGGHSVPRPMLIEWMSQGADLRCICGKKLRHNHAGERPTIDHDHVCCPGRKSCGACVRGPVCSACNTRLGALEVIIDAGLLDAYLEHIASRRASPPMSEIS
jgi:hypothetical protein